MNIHKLIQRIFGRKYYANIVHDRGTNERLLSSFIFPSRERAYAHRHELLLNRPFASPKHVVLRRRRFFNSTKKRNWLFIRNFTLVNSGNWHHKATVCPRNVL